MEFINVKQAVSAQFTKMLNTGMVLTTTVDKDVMWDTYLKLGTEQGLNDIFRERGALDCNCCRRYIRAAGGSVAFVDGKLVTMWDVNVGGEYQPIVDALAAMVRAAQIETIFLHEFKTVGVDKTPDLTTDIIWDHFFMELPSAFVKPKSQIATLKGKAVNNYNVLKRSLDGITDDAAGSVLELIDSNSIYKGQEFRARVSQLINVKQKYGKAKNKEEFLWETSLELREGSSFRNSAIGTLLVDLSEGEELEIAVKKFEAVVAPENYKRSSALITQAMINRAQDTIVELGYENSLHRRHAVIEDITINDVLFADRSAKKDMGVLGMLKPTAAKPVKPGKAEDMSIDDFMANVLPNIDSMELLLDNSHKKNLVTLVAPSNAESKPITKWDNNFSWAYNGDIADSSMREEVKAKGGRIDGPFRFTHSWNHDGNNQSLMDLHVFLPAHEDFPSPKVHDNYGNSERVGWNNRNHYSTGGVQDVDFTSPPGKSVPIENISFPSLGQMPDGTYSCKIHNWSARQNPTSGFKAEIELDGELYQYDYPNALKNKEWVDVAEVTLNKGTFTIKHMLDSNTTPQQVYGLTTKQFQKVSLVMHSPNYWDNVKNPKGNKHYFFILENCLNPEPVRGLFNEYLADSLHDHRKVFEVLGSQLKAPYNETQLSGLGFSETQTNEVTVQVRGEINKTINIKFN